MPGILRVRFREWDPGEMDTYSEMYLQEVSMAKEVIRGHVIKFEGMIWVYMTTGIVMEWDPGEMNSDGDMYLPEGSMANEVIRGHVITGIVMEWDPGEINTDSEMYLQEVSMAKGVIRGHVITGIVMQWDTKQDMGDQSASFGWCTYFRGTDVEGDAPSLEDYASQEMLGHRRQYRQQQPAGQCPHHHQE